MAKEGRNHQILSRLQLFLIFQKSLRTANGQISFISTDPFQSGGDRQEEGVASHRLGNAYEAVGDPEVATMYHKGYLERCKRDKDKLGIGRAHEALARCYQR